MQSISIDDLDFSIHARARVRNDVVGEYAARMEADGRLEESSSEARTDKNGRTMNVSGITGSNKRRARPPVSKRNQTHYDPDYDRRKSGRSRPSYRTRETASARAVIRGPLPYVSRMVRRVHPSRASTISSDAWASRRASRKPCRKL